MNQFEHHNEKVEVFVSLSHIRLGLNMCMNDFKDCVPDPPKDIRDGASNDK